MPFRFNYSTGTVESWSTVTTHWLLLDIIAQEAWAYSEKDWTKHMDYKKNYGRCGYPWESTGLFQKSTSTCVNQFSITIAKYLGQVTQREMIQLPVWRICPMNDCPHCFRPSDNEVFHDGDNKTITSWSLAKELGRDHSATVSLSMSRWHKELQKSSFLNVSVTSL